LRDESLLDNSGISVIQRDKDMKNCTICLMDDAKIAAVQRALEYDVPVRTLVALLDVSKDVVARHAKHMYDPPPLRIRQSRSRRDVMRRLAEETGLSLGQVADIMSS
jgi:hypothetical protein